MRRIHERSDELRSLCAQYLDGGEPVSQTPPVDGDGPVDVRSDESLIAKA
jgi:hypothetical protein